MGRGQPSQIAARTDDRAAANRASPGHVLKIDSPPEDMEDEHELELWRSIVPVLNEMGALVRTDLELLRHLIESLALARRYRAEERRLLNEGTVTEYDRNGDPHEVPFIGSKVEKRIRASWSDYSSQAEKLASEYGLTPTARMRLGIAEAAQNVSFSDALHALGDGS